MSKKLFYFLVGILVLIIAFSGYMIFSELFQREKEKENFENLSEIIAEPSESEPEQKNPEEEENTVRKRNLEPLFEQNPDFIGWIYIEGTAVDYPVVHTPYEPQKYLRKDFNGEYAMSGVPFLEGTRELSDDHIIIYGHNMKNGTMFSDLTKYTEKSYFDEHGIIEFETAEGLSNYEIFAVVCLRDTDIWYYFDTVLGEEHFDELITEIKSRSLYETGIVPEYGKQILTLSTCYGANDEDRIIVIGTKQ